MHAVVFGPLMHASSAAYGAVARLRRGWYASHPDSRRRLSCPVISVGNLVVGGSGKTPVVAAVAALLRDAGGRPAIVSRGYARRESTPGVLVVSDGTRVVEPTARSGDEPQMLARRLAGVPVLVCPDRHAAGQAAIDRFAATAIVLDDGFQHLRLERDLDLLLVDGNDLAERVLPSGTLREPLAAARAASAVLVHGAAAEAASIASALSVPASFTVTRRFEALRALAPWGVPLQTTPRRVVAVAGIARPQRFFAALRAAGCEVVEELVFRDHHWFTASDHARIDQAMRSRGADAVVTTEKDAVRLETWSTTHVVAYLPMTVTIAPADAFARMVTGAGSRPS